MDYPPYNPALDNRPLSDHELDQLDELLGSLNIDAAFNVEALDGYLTALLVGPGLLGRYATADWMPVVWGGDGADGTAPFPSNKQRKRAVVLVLRHLHAIAVQLQAAQDDPVHYQPIFSVAESGELELADAEDWCAGFLHAIALDEAGWDGLFTHPVLGEALAPIGVLGADPGTRDAAVADATQRDELSRAVVDGVLLLWGYQQDQKQDNAKA